MSSLISVYLKIAVAVGWIFFCKISMARTVAEQSVRDLSQVVHHTLSLPISNPTDEYVNDCNTRPENYRVRVAAVFGENELAQMAEKFNTPNQCYSTLREEEPPTGRFIHIGPDGKESQLGTGQTVHAADVVVTASHFLRYSNGRKIPPGNVVFRVYEGTPENCHEVDYPISSIEHSAEDIDTDISDDFAVIKLSRPLTTYMPLELADEELVNQAQKGSEDLVLMGFAKHEETQNGENYSAVVCKGQAPLPGNIYFGNPHVFIHDCDSTKGSSGSAFTVIRAAESALTPSGNVQKYRRYFIGLHQGHATSLQNIDPNQPSEFSPNSNFNTGITLSPKMRLMIEEAAKS